MQLVALSASLLLCAPVPAQVEVKPAPAPVRLLAELKSTDTATRRNAINQLSALRAREAVSQLIGALTDKDASIREAAAWALGQITDLSAATPLVGALADKDAEVRASAAFALGMLGDRKRVDALSKALEDPDTAVRSSAIAALGLMQDEEGVDEIAEMLGDPSFDARYDAVWALGQIGEPDTADHVRNAVAIINESRVGESMREAFRQVAQNALERIERTPADFVAPGRPRRANTPDAAPSPSSFTSAAVKQPVKAATTERALKAHITGTVELRVLVESSGRPVRAYVTRRLGYGLDQRAIEAALQYKFDPAMQGGMPQTTWVNVEVKF